MPHEWAMRKCTPCCTCIVNMPDALLQVDLKSIWTVVSSVILAFAFAFQNSVRHLFESVIFLFFTHPCAPLPCLADPPASLTQLGDG